MLQATVATLTCLEREKEKKGTPTHTCMHACIHKCVCVRSYFLFKHFRVLWTVSARFECGNREFITFSFCEQMCEFCMDLNVLNLIFLCFNHSEKLRFSYDFFLCFKGVCTVEMNNKNGCKHWLIYHIQHRFQKYTV